MCSSRREDGRGQRARAFDIHHVVVDGYRVRVGTRRRRPESTPLLICNGIGANLELLEPLVAALDELDVIAFDVPGIGGSSMPRRPYRLRHLARLVDRMLTSLGEFGQVDVLGVSWGGALAQQFARTCPHRCRRLVLAATTAGVVMVPGRAGVIARLASPRRYYDIRYLQRVAGAIYGGAFRRDPRLVSAHAKHIRPPRGRGYVFQLLAAIGWTSFFWLPSLQQPTLIMTGADDPIVPPINGELLAARLPHARLHVIDDGHLFLVARAAEAAPLIAEFLRA